ncbi:glycoside hydrolase family 43 protein [Niallia sp. JL1B1071]|uniref:glycoside hydrolase family 43 protein n=1 Tax=Niallia tiangongensis TaxID=3237105 RepID=UPI0037DD69D7
MKIDEINFRDPFILPVKSEGKYYLFGTTGITTWEGKPDGLDVYSSDDLVNWEGPFPAFRPNKDFWADQNYWAPEVHEWNGKYFMFASFKSEDRRRCTQILVSDKPEGPYVPHGSEHFTPKEWECLDGTFYVDKKGVPWMIFCHEWVQIEIGKMCAVKLSEDLTEPVSDPIDLFRATDAPWVRPVKEDHYFVTDGPFLYRAKNNELLMMWSSFGDKGYAIGLARSESGDVKGPWNHDDQPIFGKDGGHGMLFETFAGELKLVIHAPNDTPNERPMFFSVSEDNGTLSIK